MVKFIHPKRGTRKHRRDSPKLLGETFTARAEDLGGRGQAVVTHPQGQKVFVSGAWPGELIKIKITSVKQQTAFAELLEIVEPHPQRVTPSCHYQGTGRENCGGCEWMFMDYPAQLAAKQMRLAGAMQKIGMQPNALAEILPSPTQNQYRNRAQVKTDGERLGFLAHGSQQLVDVQHCEILQPELQKQLTQLRAQLPNRQWHARRKQLTSIDIDGEQFSVNRRLPFRQANTAQNNAMRQWLDQNLQTLPRDFSVLELFAGSGNFTEVLAGAGFTSITAVEAVSEATTALSEKKLHGVNVYPCDLYKETDVLDLAVKCKESQVLVLDPPRDGFKFLQPLVSAFPNLVQVFYISCDLATFCRDVEALLALGFTCELVQPLDLFPQTPHVELLAKLHRVV